MERILQETTDGSHTIAIPELQVTYHSRHGAIQESLHIFIEAGWRKLQKKPDQSITILEMGFGTGLNALLTLLNAEGRSIWYESLEAYPIDLETAGKLNYCQQIGRKDLQPIFDQMHQADWNQAVEILPSFTLHKRREQLENYTTDRKFDLVYFDAFAPNVQPQLWTETIFRKVYNMLHPEAILVTYCSKGAVRRALKAAGFGVTKIPGPPGKWEIVRAIKLK